MIGVLLAFLAPARFVPLEASLRRGMIRVRAESKTGTDWFLLDSGVNRTVTFREAKAAGGEEDVAVPYGERSQTVSAYVAPEPPASPFLGWPVQGLVGMDFLADKAVAIDYGQEKVGLCAEGDVGPTEAATQLGIPVGRVRTIPLEAKGDFLYVRTTVNRKPALMLLDTGATGVAISPSWLAAQRIRTTRSVKVNQAGTIGERKVYEGLKMQAGGAVLLAKEAFEASPDDADEGTVGPWSFTRGRVVIDFKASRLYFAAP